MAWRLAKGMITCIYIDNMYILLYYNHKWKGLLLSLFPERTRISMYILSWWTRYFFIRDWKANPFSIFVSREGKLIWSILTFAYSYLHVDLSIKVITLSFPAVVAYSHTRPESELRLNSLSSKWILCVPWSSPRLSILGSNSNSCVKAPPKICVSSIQSFLFPLALWSNPTNTLLLLFAAFPLPKQSTLSVSCLFIYWFPC